MKKLLIQKKMKQMQLDYVYNFNTKSITFENPRVDGKQNQKLDEFLNKDKLVESAA